MVLIGAADSPRKQVYHTLLQIASVFLDFCRFLFAVHRHFRLYINK